MKRQTRQVLELLRSHPDGVTPAEARSALACDRLAARVHELRADGHIIEAVRERTPMGATIARYYYLREPMRFVRVTGAQEGLDL